MNQPKYASIIKDNIQITCQFDSNPDQDAFMTTLDAILEIFLNNPKEQQPVIVDFTLNKEEYRAVVEYLN